VCIWENWMLPNLFIACFLSPTFSAKIYFQNHNIDPSLNCFVGPFLTFSLFQATWICWAAWAIQIIIIQLPTPKSTSTWSSSHFLEFKKVPRMSYRLFRVYQVHE
jgi:hypothetical protein